MVDTVVLHKRDRMSKINKKILKEEDLSFGPPFSECSYCTRYAVKKVIIDFGGELPGSFRYQTLKLCKIHVEEMEQS